MEFQEERLSRAISASSRRNILRLLGEKELTVKEIAQKSGQSVSLASRHLKLLYDLGFLKVKKEFPHKFYSLKNKEMLSLLSTYEKVIRKLPSEAIEVQEEKLSRAIHAQSRRNILNLISEKQLTVKEIAQKTQQSVSLASRHLKFLYDLGFLQVQTKFPNKWYSLKIKELRELLLVYDKVINKL